MREEGAREAPCSTGPLLCTPPSLITALPALGPLLYVFNHSPRSPHPHLYAGLRSGASSSAPPGPNPGHHRGSWLLCVWLTGRGRRGKRTRSEVGGGDRKEWGWHGGDGHL
jgi:hypothetical protein